MKIAFFSNRPYGLRGTPGTFRFVEKMRTYCEHLVFAPIGKDDIVYSHDDVPLIPIDDLSHNESINEIIPIVLAFKPDIIYIFNYAGWFHLLKTLKSELPAAKFILDIKTPLLAHGNRRREIQTLGSLEHDKLDAIVTLSFQSAQTWIPDFKTETIVYPLGIELSMFTPQDLKATQTCLNRFVYIGSLHPKRQTSLLINAFEEFSNKANAQVSLDIFGSGPDFENLKSCIADNEKNTTIKLCGLLPQSELLTVLPNYDVGIGWVPYQYYNDSPSLKVLEYMAAGLPVVASDTDAHKKLLAQDFSFELFSNEIPSFVSSLNALLENGFSAQRREQNYNAVKKYDYSYIIENYMLPLFEKVTDRIPIQRISDHFSTHSGTPEKSSNEDQHTFSKGKNLLRGRSEKRKICLHCESLAMGKGGAERVAMELANELSRRGHHIYMAYKNKGQPAYKANEGVILLPYDYLSGLAKRVHMMDPDIFFSFYFNHLLIDYYAVIHGTKIPFGMQECTNPTRLYSHNWRRGGIDHVRAKWEREIIASAAACIRLTMPGYAKSFPDYIRPIVRTFPNPAFPQTQEYRKIPRGKLRKQIINVNGFKANKNLITLIKAFHRLAVTYHDWDLKIIGKSSDGKQPHKLEIMNYIEENRLQERVLISGPTDDIFKAYMDADIHVIASLSEGCPTVVLEAMSVGLPSIGFSDCPGTNELIQHKKNGLLANTNDRVMDLEAVLRQLMASENQRYLYGRQAFEDSKAFKPATIYDSWERLFIEAAEYKKEPDRLLHEQMDIDPERALHARRMRNLLIKSISN